MILDGIVYLSTSIVINLVNIFLPLADSNVTSKFSDGTSTIRGVLVANNFWFPVNYALFFISTAFFITGIVIVWLIVRFIAGMFTLGAVK